MSRLRPLVPPIVLLGPPGAGKSTVGPRLAAALGFSFVDLDERARADRFLEDGEARFRVREHLALREALTDRPGGAVVVDAGAGVIDVDENLPLLERALCLVVDVDLPTSLVRLGPNPRPWLRGVEDPLAVLRAREAGRAERRASLAARTGGLVVDGTDAVDRVLTALVDAVEAARLPCGDDPDVSETLTTGVAGRCFVVADPRVADVVERHGTDVDLAIAIPPFDKRLATVERLLSAFVAAGVRRNDTIVAVGGGVLLDVVGLAAALHHRGTPWRAVPTTLLAMVDAALGGKTAVDIDAVDDDATDDASGPDGRASLRIRNAAGAFHPPASATVWPGFLRSLDDDALRQGRAEMLKHALLAGDLDRDLDAAVSGTLDAAHLARSRGIKRAVVERDPDERHLRHALNLGHTVAHGLESGLGLAHGDAVLHGLRAALWLSEREAGLDVAVAKRARAAIAALAPPALPALDDDALAALAAACRRDKKGGRLVLLRAPGAPVLAEVDDGAVLAAVRSLLPPS